MPLRVVTRTDTGSLTIAGRIKLTSGETIRVRQRARSNDRRVAEEEAKHLELTILRDDWIGKRGGSASLAEGVLAYIKAHPEATDATKDRYNRVLKAVGDVPASSIDQTTVTRLIDSGFLMEARHRQAERRAEKLGLAPPPRPVPAPGTITREIINPLRAACAMVNVTPKFVIPPEPAGRTIYLFPDEAERVIDAAAPHLQPLLIFFACQGPRAGESLKLRWDDRPPPIDLDGARVILFADTRKGKQGQQKQRILPLTPRAVAALAALPYREGAVFRTPDGEPYVVPEGGGSPIKKAHQTAVRRAGLDPKVYTPHVWRHTWATWHYAIHKDPMKLMVDGGWSDLSLVVRYAHLMPAGREAAIKAFWGYAQNTDLVTPWTRSLDTGT